MRMRMRALSIGRGNIEKRENVLFRGAKKIFVTECSHGIHKNQRNAVMETEMMMKKIKKKH